MHPQLGTVEAVNQIVIDKQLEPRTDIDAHFILPTKPDSLK